MPPVKVFHSIAELKGVPGPVVLAIGVFDGIHLGHRAVIERARRDAENAGGAAVIVTFDPHPIRVLRPECAPRLLTSTSHKIRLLDALGISHLLIVPFDSAFAATAPEEFIHQLHGACRPLREICVGHEWSFGKNRAGNLQLLDRLGEQLGFEEVGVPAVKIRGEIVSSTLIRAAVEMGDLEKASLFLGREYSVLGTVIEGDHLGRQLGFPTANLSAHSEQFPPDGVYAAEAIFHGQRHRGVINIGVRPTVQPNDARRLLELHLFDFRADIYGEDVEVFFRKFLRPERKFAALEELKTQIQQDCATARKALSS